MKFTTLIIAAAFAMAAVTAQADDSVADTPSAEAMAVDLILVRPLGLVATVLGTGLFIVDLPFALLSGSLPSDPAKRLVVEPAKFTFSRPLGQMD